ncbi:MAG: prolipoprotein diacylglyceryl transferase [Pseudomonadota bacterium]
MWNYPDIDPVAISLGPLSIHWYALSYMVGIAITWWLVGYRARHRPDLDWNPEQISDLVFYGVLGVIVGGRLGYVLFYNLPVLAADPLSLFRIWEGGMSFHGGMLGVLVGMYLYARWHGRHFFQITDYIAPAIPIALGCGRLGNFANGELPGRVTDLPWALVYPGDVVGRHPSSLYQFVLEGIVLFALMWVYSNRPRPMMAVSGLFLLGYGSLRIVAEFFREPDAHIGFIAWGWVTVGQTLSLPMALAGAGMMVFAYRSATAGPSVVAPNPPSTTKPVRPPNRKKKKVKHDN